MSEKEWKTLCMVLRGAPRTKKNSSRIVVNKATGRAMVMPSKEYKEYEELCGWSIPAWARALKIDEPVNLKCVYYMPTRRRVDLVNLLSATCDILVKYGVLADDNSNIVASHDGCRVEYSKENPRVEIEIRKKEG